MNEVVGGQKQQIRCWSKTAVTGGTTADNTDWKAIKDK
jgi:hypothetical protein